MVKTNSSLMVEWMAADAERDARTAQERADYLASLKTQVTLSAEHVAADKAYKAAKKAARKAGIPMAVFVANYSKTLNK